MTAPPRPLALAAALALAACSGGAEDPLFVALDPAETGVAFENVLEEGAGLNILSYLYYYNGGGAAKLHRPLRALGGAVTAPPRPRAGRP